MKGGKMFKKISILLFLGFSLLFASEPVYVEKFTGMEFVFVKGGCYEMGDSYGDGDVNERPVHEVCVKDFYISKYEVTNAQFRKFKPEHSSGKHDGISLDDDNQPVVNVSWFDAVNFAKWLSKKTGQNFRLPTEAEWEYAARGGTKTSRFWGNDPEDACLYANVADLTAKKRWQTWIVHNCEDNFIASAPVGSFKPNGFGIFDMLGNVWEWVQDVYDSVAYSKHPRNNPVYEVPGEYRVMRGGCWSNGPLGVRSSHRVALTPKFGHQSLGFRLVKDKER